MKISNRVFSVKATKEGYLTRINALGLGEVARKIGAGRLTKKDSIDPTVGLVLSKKRGDYVKVGDELVKVYLNEKDIKLIEILDCFEINENKAKDIPLIYEILK